MLDNNKESAKTILLIGCCGSGKTWVMKSIINKYKALKRQKIGKVYFQSNDELIILGKYDGQTFEGSDRLSMSVVTDLGKLISVQGEKTIIAEGDRFTNSRFIGEMKPIIIKITDDGAKGRKLRGSNQTERHLKSVTTRVSNISATFEVKNSQEAFKLIENLLKLN